MFVGHTQVGMIIHGLGGTSNYQMMMEIMVTLPPGSKACVFLVALVINFHPPKLGPTSSSASSRRPEYISHSVVLKMSWQKKLNWKKCLESKMSWGNCGWVRCSWIIINLSYNVNVASLLECFIMSHHPYPKKKWCITSPEFVANSPECGQPTDIYTLLLQLLLELLVFCRGFHPRTTTPRHQTTTRPQEPSQE